MNALILLLSIFLFAVDTAQAQAPADQATVYVEGTVGNLMKAMLRAGALDPKETVVRDDYLIANECELYRANYKDEFKLRRLEEATGKLIDQQRAGWPNSFTLVSPLQLDRYNFEREQFALTRDSALNNVNSFQLRGGSRSAPCGQTLQPQRFPDAVSIRIDQPVTLAGIPLDRAAAEALLHRLQERPTGADSRLQRLVYARFSFEATFMPPVTAQTKSHYVFDGRLMMIEFFEDEKLTKPLWKLTR